MFILETDRLIIRKFVPEDWKDLYEYLSIEEVVKYEPRIIMEKVMQLKPVIKY